MSKSTNQRTVLTISSQQIQVETSTIRTTASMDGDGASISAGLALVHPNRYLTFTLPNPNFTSTTDHLRVAVLDSPFSSSSTPPPLLTAAMLVPFGREPDWIFSTFEGHLQLLLSSSSSSYPISRLVLIGNTHDGLGSSFVAYTKPEVKIDTEKLERSLLPLLLALCPKSAFDNGIPEVPFLNYEDDDVVSIVPVERAVGSVVGEMVVEDVEIEIQGEVSSKTREVRRRLRFRRMPNLVQTQIRISTRDRKIDATPTVDLLVQPYLGPMVAGLSLIVPALEEKLRMGLRPRVLCAGVGGGGLPMFLQSKLGFDVIGVEADAVVLDIAKRHFGLIEGEFLKVFVGDGIEIMENSAKSGLCSSREENWAEGIDAIMVDLDSGDAGSGFTAPPLEFVKRSVLAGARSALSKNGILVINVVPLNELFYHELIGLLREVFSEVYEIDVGNGENYVVVATTDPVVSSHSGNHNSFLMKLAEMVDQISVTAIRKI